MKNIVKFCFGLIFLTFSCKDFTEETNQNIEKKRPENIISLKQKISNENNFKQKDKFLNPKSFNSFSLLKAIRINKTKKNTLPFLTIENEFPENWVKFEDINELIKLIDSKEKCKCLVNPLSSYLPTNEKANIGGFAVLLINSFKNNTKIDIGLYNCTETSKNEIREIKKWWNENKTNKKPNG